MKMDMKTRNDKIQIALDLISLHHKGQFRKGKKDGISLPYLVHPIAVMQLLWNWGIGNPLVLTAALAHDLLEDTKCSVDELYVFLGDSVTEWVQDLTFIPAKETPKSEIKALKEKYMLTFKDKPIEVLLIKLADRFCNVLDFLQEDPKYALIYLNKAAALLDAFQNRQDEIFEEFGTKVYINICENHNSVEAACMPK